ncbi:NAD-dependent epimerase/dehydratase family protein [Primorskyibacter sp. S187A]|uniref:NAD-dependent epimerase/dehydratase family protein n=1 Tax=Primorskyibacter sp. S187A TaxID=3415130 RepID=UPI003C79EA9A
MPQCDAVLVLWGITRGTPGELAQNASLAQKSLEIAGVCGAQRVLFVSTGAVYGRADNPQNEDSPTPGLGAYGAEKKRAEDVVLDSGLEACVLRLANVAGADALFGAMGRDEVITLDQFENGLSPRRSYLSPQDFAVALKALVLEERLPRILNIAGPRPVDMKAIVDAARVPFSLRDAPKTALPLHVLDVSKLRDLGVVLEASASPRHLASFASERVET